MELSHLQTKLIRPEITDTFVPRPLLLQQLCAGIDRKVTLISAPAGFGKSTLVSSWLDHLEAAPMQRKSAWLGLDEADNLLPRFVAYVVEAIEASCPDCCSAARELLRQRPAPTVEALADVLIISLNRHPDPFVLVLDDLHTISNSAIHVFLTRLVEYAPSHFHLVMISRIDPPIALSRWRAQGKLNELRLTDLSFTLEETAAFLGRALATMPRADLIRTLHERTEGWAVGIWMAVLALRNQTDYAEFESHLNIAKHRYLVDYLVEEVLNHQPAPLSSFLVNTAILKHFCAGLCAAVTETGAANAQQQIDELARTNLFVIELSSPPFWYRYHHQFRDMLLSRLHMRSDPAAIAGLHRRAAAWLAANNDIDEALGHLMAIPDPDAAAELVTQQRIEPLNGLQFFDLDAWLRKLPLALIYQRADLLIGMAWIKHDQVDKEACLALVRQAEALLEGEPAAALPADRHLLRAELNALRIAHDNTLTAETGLALIRQSWTLIRDHLARTHCSVVLSLAYGSLELGELASAMTIAQTALEEAPQWPLTARCRIAHAAGTFHLCNGEIAEAERQFQQNLRLAQEHHLAVIAIISRHGLGALADVRNQTEEARQHHTEVVRHPFLTSGRNAIISMYSLIGIYGRSGESERIWALVDQMKEDASIMGKSYFIEQAVALEAYANLTCGQVKPALLWAVSTPHHAMETTYDRIPLIRARILLGCGSDACLLEAGQILQELIAFYANSFVWHRQTEVLLLQALVQDRLNKPDSALESLAQAVELAVPKGGAGLFMGYGEAVGHMLRRLATQPSLSRHVALLLAAFGADDLVQDKPTSAQKLPEPLTERELDVLVLLAERLSNIEIARRMYLSPHTVRNHLANIFGKLQVQNRAQAVARARELDLLDSRFHRR
jgi:LuxR family maltose regulon positive regulatory protein